MDHRVMREEILAYKRERILEEAVKLFYQRGFTGTTLDDIAAELGVTKPFIYTHFRSKTDLLAALCKPTIELSLEAVARAAKSSGSPTARLHRAIVGFTEVVLSRQANIAIYFREEKNLAPDALTEINALRKKFDRVLSNLLTEGVAAGEFAAVGDDDGWIILPPKKSIRDWAFTALVENAQAEPNGNALRWWPNAL